MLLLRGATLNGADELNCSLFQYMLLLRGATPSSRRNIEPETFQYMLLLRGATCIFLYSEWGTCFNTCSSCEEQHAKKFIFSLAKYSFNTCSSCEEQHELYRRVKTGGVSIHAPLARSNKDPVDAIRLHEVSIHAPLARSNCRSKDCAGVGRSFNTCSSCEEQQMLVPKTGFLLLRFQYMLLLRGATGVI